jgi:DNA polymerase-3 subunit alpha/error-prone DNA polymerase
VFGLPETEIGKVSKRLPWFWRLNEAPDDLLNRIKIRPEFRFMDFPQPWPAIMAYAQAIIGTPRTLSVHPGGIVITPGPINTYVPVQTAPKGVPIIQWDKDGAESAGLVKIDLLGNRSLGVIRDSIESIRRSSGKFDDFNTLDPEDDHDTRQTVAQGNTMGCFYIESPAMRLLQKKTRVGDFAHVVIHSSIIRPAANTFIQDYIQRLHTGVWKPIHPLLETVLDETFGIMVFQEDVSRVAVKIAGFTHAAADGLRKIISKKDRETELADYHDRFEQGALARGVGPADIKRIWDMIASFSGYSFCKPHSASYARVSFQAAYLKTHYPAQFMAAVISNQGGFYSTFAYVSEAQRLKVKILAPDITVSQIRWTGKNLRLRVGLMAIQDLSAKTMQAIVEQRRTKKFTGLEDFFARVNPRENEVRSLVHSGCLDTLYTMDPLYTLNARHATGHGPDTPDTPGAGEANRAAILWAFASRHRQKRKQGTDQHPSLFAVHDFDPVRQAPGRSAKTPAAKIGSGTTIPDLPREDPVERLRREFFALGFLCTCHPILLFKEVLRQFNTIKAIHLPQFINKNVIFAGWLITGKVVKTRHGDPMKFLTFEDETGTVETVFFPKPYALFCHMLDYGRPYLVYGKPDSNWGAVTLVVEKTRPVPSLPGRSTCRPPGVDI